ncbi:MAG TPA: DUF433 domain-containing protein [Solirubrobacter sp.]|jgi:uncharacterized protein (DUF433 family)
MYDLWITRREAAALSGTSETTVKKAIDLGIIPARPAGGQSRIDAADVPVLTMLGHLNGIGLGAAHKRRLRRWLREAEPAPELALVPGLIVRRLDDVEQARDRAERYVHLRAQWIVSDPEIKGGEPVIRGSRVSVHTLAARIADGDSDAVLDEDFPHIPAEAREVAALYARANPRRGRPPRARVAA